MLLKARSRVLALDKGRQIKTHLFNTGLESDLHVRNALIHLYCSCGAVDDAQNLFNRMPVSGNAVILGCAQNGPAGDALRLFRELQQLTGSRPDEIPKVGVLNAD